MGLNPFIMYATDCFQHPETGYLVSGLMLSGSLGLNEIGQNLYFLAENRPRTEITLAGLAIERFQDMTRIKRRECSLHVRLLPKPSDHEPLKDGFLIQKEENWQLITVNGKIKRNNWR